MKRKDYMGVMVVNHYVSSDALICHGSQSPVNAITEIAVYEAGYDDNGKIIKGDLLSKVRMSDLQFGKLIARPNVTGHPATLEHLVNYNIHDAHLEESPDINRLSREVKKSANKDSQTLRFINEIEAIIEESKSKKRIVKKKDLQKLLALILSNAPSNFKYHFEEVGKVGNHRVIEAKSQIHSMVRNAYRLHEEPLLIEKDKDDGHNVVSCLCSAVITHYSGRTRLFDAIGDSNEYASFNVTGGSVADIDKQLDEIEDAKSDTSRSDIYMNRELLEVYMSLEQYARFVRADNTEVPCTISRIGQIKPNDKVEVDRREQLIGDLNKDSDAVLSNLLKTVKAAKELIEKTGCNAAKHRSELIELCESLTACYEDTLPKIRQHSNEVVTKVMKSYQDEIEAYMGEELEKLPSEHRSKLLSLLNNGK